MAKETKDVWLRVLIGFIVTAMCLLVTAVFAGYNKLDDSKVEKEVFSQHEKYQSEQFTEIKDSLKRIEGKL